MPALTLPTARPTVAATARRAAQAVRGHVARLVRVVAQRSERRDAGDVPGWVLVTLMTAGLVLAIWAVAGPALTDLFTTAISRVTSFGG